MSGLVTLSSQTPLQLRPLLHSSELCIQRVSRRSCTQRWSRYFRRQLKDDTRDGVGVVTDVRTAEADPPWEGLHGSERYAACMHAARAGNRRALATLVEDLTPLVWHVARGNGLHRTAAEDVVQTVWLALISHIDTLAEPKALAGWLITTTRREAQRVRNKVAAQLPLSDEMAETLPSKHPQPEDEALRADRDVRLWRAFGELPERCQQLLRLTVLAGRTEYRQVAEAMQMPRGSIGPTRGRCLNTLRELLDTEGGGG
jgi:RNA polymerase sigma factor (sigma-70 family)